MTPDTTSDLAEILSAPAPSAWTGADLYPLVGTNLYPRTSPPASSGMRVTGKPDLLFITSALVASLVIYVLLVAVMVLS